MIKCFKARISGRVQGVSFRMHTQRKANSLGLKGWVRNCEDGAVEVLAEGEDGSVDSFLNFLYIGPSSAEVETVDVEWLEAIGGYSGFNVRY